MLPIINEDQKDTVITAILDDIHAWRKSMIHYIKDENPEINQSIIDIASNTDLDPKAVATGAYMAYKLIENAQAEENSMIIDE